MIAEMLSNRLHKFSEPLGYVVYLTSRWHSIVERIGCQLVAEQVSSGSRLQSPPHFLMCGNCIFGEPCGRHETMHFIGEHLAMDDVIIGQLNSVALITVLGAVVGNVAWFLLVRIIYIYCLVM